MKKILTLILAMSFAISAVAVSDMNGHWAEEIVEKWVNAGDIGGYPDGTFRPQNPISRAEFAVMLSRILDEEREAVTLDINFSDVTPDDWFYPEVIRLATYGVIANVEKFNPDRHITREEAMTMIGRCYGLANDDTSVLDAFKDVHDIADYAKAFAAALVENKTVGGYPDETLRPKANITRAESVKMLDIFVKEADLTTLEGIMDAIYSGTGHEFPNLATTPITKENSEYFLGVADLEFKEALASEPMMSAQAHSVCLVRLNEGQDAKAIAEKIRQSVNPRKWVCVGVEREEVICAVRGDLILLIIDRVAPKAIETSFLKLELQDGFNTQTLVKDESGYMLHNGQYINDFGAFNENSAIKFADKINSIYDKYLTDNEKVYYAVIPSKNYYINHMLPGAFDYDRLNSTLRNNIMGAYEINLYDTLSFDDYLKTDFHWKQESLQKVVNRLGDFFDFEISLDNYKKNIAEGFTGQFGYNKKDFLKEELCYLTSSVTEKASVENYQDASFKGVYHLDKLNTTSQYDVFLSGPTPLTKITNEEATTDKSLIIFRDSFGSSLAPLLIENYREITLIDIRYVMSDALAEFVDFSGCDVLFLYNDQIINNSDMLK